MFIFIIVHELQIASSLSLSSIEFVIGWSPKKRFGSLDFFWHNLIEIGGLNISTWTRIVYFVNHLKFADQNQNTKYCKVVPINICVCCIVYQLSQSANCLVYNVQLFVVGNQQYF